MSKVGSLRDRPRNTLDSIPINLLQWLLIYDRALPSPEMDTTRTELEPVNLTTKIAYGIGGVSGEVPGSIIVFFLLFFLTNVAGLNPSLAGGVLLVSKVWDAINDPLVGWLSDRTTSPLGRRYPWMLFGAIPLGVFFFLLWRVPNLPDQTWLFIYYCAISLLFYTAYTTVVIPYSTLAAELTQTFNERTSLASYKGSFSIGSSILSLVLAQAVIAVVEEPAQQFSYLGAICGAVAALAAYGCFRGTMKRFRRVQEQRTLVSQAAPISFLEQIRTVSRNRPFLYVVGLYLCSWLGVQVTAAILPYFVVDRMGLPDHHFTQMALAVQGTALVSMVGWSILGQRIGKKAIYGLGMPLTMVAQAGLFFLQPGQVAGMYGLAVLAGLGLSTAYLVPWSMLPDVVDLDEANTGYRREGMYYGFVVQLQKFAVAIALFLVGKTLDVAGLIPSVSGSEPPIHPDSAILAIRWLIGPIPSLVLLGGLAMAWRYPINQAFHQQIMDRLFSQRKERPL